MNAEQEIERLLAASNAVLVRRNKHLVYRLQNGRTFVMSKTPRDAVRSARNSLVDLKRALGITRKPLVNQQQETAMQMQELPGPVPIRASVPPDQSALKRRIEVAITLAETDQEKLLAEAQAIERRVQLLRALLPFTEDPSAEAALVALVPPPDPPKVKAAPQVPPAPPERITERVQVTRELVFAATQTFDNDFTVNDVLSAMTKGADIDGTERTRVRSSIASAMMALLDRGQLLRVVAGVGKRQSVWRKSPFNGHGTRA